MMQEVIKGGNGLAKVWMPQQELLHEALVDPWFSQHVDELTEGKEAFLKLGNCELDDWTPFIIAGALVKHFPLLASQLQSILTELSDWNEIL